MLEQGLSSDSSTQGAATEGSNEVNSSTTHIAGYSFDRAMNDEVGVVFSDGSSSLYFSDSTGGAISPDGTRVLFSTAEVNSSGDVTMRESEYLVTQCPEELREKLEIMQSCKNADVNPCARTTKEATPMVYLKGFIEEENAKLFHLSDGTLHMFNGNSQLIISSKGRVIEFINEKKHRLVTSIDQIAQLDIDDSLQVHLLIAQEMMTGFIPVYDPNSAESE